MKDGYRRGGRFGVSRQLVEKDEETVRAIMGRCVIVECEFRADVFRYAAVSPDFDPIPIGEIWPEYVVIITDNGKSISFKRVID